MKFTEWAEAEIAGEVATIEKYEAEFSTVKARYDELRAAMKLVETFSNAKGLIEKGLKAERSSLKYFLREIKRAKQRIARINNPIEVCSAEQYIALCRGYEEAEDGHKFQYYAMCFGRVREMYLFTNNDGTASFKYCIVGGEAGAYEYTRCDFVEGKLVINEAIEPVVDDFLAAVKYAVTTWA